MRNILLLMAAMSLPFAAVSAMGQSSPKMALSLEQKSTLRCAAAFAIIADGQARGNAEALAYPELGERGREFFVRSSVRLMDQTGMDRATIAAIMQREAQELWDKNQVEQIMPSCMLLLTASGI